MAPAAQCDRGMPNDAMIVLNTGANNGVGRSIAAQLGWLGHGLQHDHGQAVADDIMQLARDPRTLVAQRDDLRLLGCRGRNAITSARLVCRLTSQPPPPPHGAECQCQEV